MATAAQLQSTLDSLEILQTIRPRRSHVVWSLAMWRKRQPSWAWSNPSEAERKLEANRKISEKVTRTYLTKRTSRWREEQSEFWNEFHRYLMSGENGK